MAAKRYVTFQKIVVIKYSEITVQPPSGQYSERIYDISNPWNSPGWTWIKFTNDDGNVWIGQFRGFPIANAISEKSHYALILTSDYLFEINKSNGDINSLDKQTQIQNIAVAPNGVYILSDYYNVYYAEKSAENAIEILSPIEMDNIRFIDFENSNLVFSCDEIAAYEKQYEMEVDTKTWTLKIRNVT